MKKALQIKKEQKLYAPLGEVCVSEGFLSRSDLRRVLSEHHKNIPLGELLINMRLISEEQLKQALEEQKVSGKKLGQILVAQGILSEATLVDALSIQLGIPKILPSLSLIDKTLLDKFNPEFLHKHQFVPAFRQGDTLTVIMADPLDEERICFLSRTLRCKIVPAIAAPSDIRKAIKIYFQKLEMGQELTSEETAKDLVIGDQELFKKDGDNLVEMVNFIISNAILDRATDIHIEPQDRLLRIRYRIDGILHHKTDLPNAIAAKFISRIKAVCGLDIAEKRRHQDGRIQARILNKEYDLRVSTYAAIWGENVVIRIQSRQSKLTDLHSLGFSPANLFRYVSMLEHPSGIILVTGPTGSGKSTTLYASLQHLNRMDRVIITVEDPVEYTIDGVVQASIQAKVGVKYSDYLKAMMRQDPDVLMIGEIRDAEAAEAVIQASLTGHKVLSTFHTDDATGALLRLMDMGIETFLISSTLVSVVAQRLVRVLCPHCKEEAQPSKRTLHFFNSIKKDTIHRYKFYKPKGCIHCNHTGFKGMTAIHEVLMVNDAIRDAILKRGTSIEIKRIARKEAGLVSMSEDGFYKAVKGVTSLEEIIRVVYRDESKGLVPISIEELIVRSERAAP
ncbi:MAG: type II/IV secretion system protein [Calditrichaeota bacterium]|nr:MAG: type II/IV secretion system protein [Calditrichota bacterium]